MKLTNLAVATLGIHLGFKSHYRETEAKRWGIEDFGEANEQLISEVPGIEHCDRKELYKLFREYTGEKTLASQTHWYMKQLGFETEMMRKRS